MDGHIAILNRFLSSLDVNRDVGLAVARGDNIGAFQNPAFGQVAVSNGNLAIDNLNLGTANFIGVVLEEVDSYIAILNRCSRLFVQIHRGQPSTIVVKYHLGSNHVILRHFVRRNLNCTSLSFALRGFHFNQSILVNPILCVVINKANTDRNSVICKRCKRHAHDNHEHSRQQSKQTSFEVRFLHVNFSYSLKFI